MNDLGDGDDVEALAGEMLAECVKAEQSVRRVPDDDAAEQVRTTVRSLARARGVRLRTARLDDTVVVVRLDAAVWKASAEEMRATLTLPERSE